MARSLRSGDPRRASVGVLSVPNLKFGNVRQRLSFRRNAATLSRARPRRDMVEPASGTLTAVGPAWTTRSAFTGKARAKVVAAVRTSRRVNEDFIDS